MTERECETVKARWLSEGWLVRESLNENGSEMAMTEMMQTMYEGWLLLECVCERERNVGTTCLL